MSIKQNTTNLQEILETINNLPESGGTDTSDATATASEIFAGETAYVADGKVTGTFTIDNEIATQNDLIAQIAELVETKATPQGGTDTSDATATASDILSGKTAYALGGKITGNIATKTRSDLFISSASAGTIVVPAGYYASQVTKSIASGSAKTPATTVTKNPTISIDSSGKITASVSGTQSVTPTVTAGYVSSGTAGTITVSGSATQQLTTQAAKTVTPSTSNQTAVASGIYTTGAVTVAGDSNLVPANIAEGVSIFGVSGTHSGSENLNTELTEQENLISQLSTILDSKASGGSGDENKTVSITISMNSFMAYGFDANGNALAVNSGTYDFLDGIVSLPLPFGSVVGISGTYIQCPIGDYGILYKFTGDYGTIEYQGGSSGGNDN